MAKTLVHAPEIEELFDELQALKNKEDDASKKRVAELAEEIYELYNPLDNKIEGEGATVKWKVDPDFGDLGKTDFKIEFNKDMINDDVEFYVKVNGDVSVFKSGINEKNLNGSFGFKVRF